MSPEPSSTVPADLLQAVASRGGRVALVVGAGCSVEDPTGLKLASEYSAEVHGQLVADGVIQPDECQDVEDLSALAEFVVERTGSKEGIVARLPKRAFRLARPNSGYLDVAALMIEGAINCVITLNYDMALTNALVELGANDVDVISGPETVHDFGAKCVIYLHGNADCAADDWILRKSELEDAWDETWKDLVARRVSATPFLVFAGLGSPAAILTESVTRVRQIDPGAPNIYLVDPNNASAFGTDLALPDSNMVKLAWCEFMTRLSRRLVRECCKAIRSSAESLCVEHGWGIEGGRFDDLVSCLQCADLRTLGVVRAAWLCKPVPYYPDVEGARLPMAQLLLALGEILADPAHAFSAVRDGRIRISADGTTLGSVMGLHGAGVKLWAQAPDALRAATAEMSDLPDLVLAAGFTGPRIEDLAPPESVVHGPDDDDIVMGAFSPRMINIDTIKGSGHTFADLVA